MAVNSSPPPVLLGSTSLDEDMKVRPKRFKLQLLSHTSPCGCTDFRKVLKHQPTSMAALQTLGGRTFNKFIVHVNNSLLSYPLEMVARVALVGLGQNLDSKQEEAEIVKAAKALEVSVEKLVGSDVVFFKHLHVGSRVLGMFSFSFHAKGPYLNPFSPVVYAVKKLLQVTLSLHVLEVMADTNDPGLTPKREQRGRIPSSFRPFGDVSFYFYLLICLSMRGCV